MPQPSNRTARRSKTSNFAKPSLLAMCIVETVALFLCFMLHIVFTSGDSIPPCDSLGGPYPPPIKCAKFPIAKNSHEVSKKMLGASISSDHLLCRGECEMNYLEFIAENPKAIKVVKGGSIDSQDVKDVEPCCVVYARPMCFTESDEETGKIILAGCTTNAKKNRERFKTRKEQFGYVSSCFVGCLFPPFSDFLCCSQSPFLETTK